MNKEQKKTIVKIMSISSREYQRSLIKLYPGIAGISDFHTIRIPLGKDVYNEQIFQSPNGKNHEQYVELRFDSKDTRTVGGLLNLPQAQITMTFNQLSTKDIENFMDRFDRVFQRGGG